MDLAEFGIVANPDDEGGHWLDNALCAQTDPELFFPEKGSSTSPAKKVCDNCLVWLQCLGDAITREDRFGIKGGLSERERRRLIKLGIDPASFASPKELSEFLKANKKILSKNDHEDGEAAV